MATAKKATKKAKAPAAQTPVEAAPVAVEPEITITTYKGFDKDLKCRGFQYTIGGTVQEETAEACKTGFHACEHPLDVFSYYAPAGNRFAVVEQSGQLSRHSDDSKVASSKLTVKAELNLAGIIKAAIEYTTKRCKPIDPESPASATGDQGAAMASGYEGRASGVDGNALFLVFRDQNWNIVHAKAAIVGRDGNIFFTNIGKLNAAINAKGTP